MGKIGRVLFIDDDTINSFINKDFIEKLGIAREVQSFDCPFQALDHIHEYYYQKPGKQEACLDLIFLDIRMPMLDGFEFLEVLDELTGIDRSRFSVAILTGYNHPQIRERADLLHSKILGLLHKPLKEEDVSSIFLNLLAQCNS